MLSRDDAWPLLNEYVLSPNLIKHCLSTEVIMRSLARRLGKDPDVWGVTGLLHDLDFDLTKDNPSRHALKSAEILREKNMPEDCIHAIISHNEAVEGVARTSEFDHALACAESITGLIVATALVYPDKKISSVKPKSVKKRMKERAFAANVSREAIMECEQIGISLQEFIELSLEAMGEIASDLEL